MSRMTLINKANQGFHLQKPRYVKWFMVHTTVIKLFFRADYYGVTSMYVVSTSDLVNLKYTLFYCSKLKLYIIRRYIYSFGYSSRKPSRLVIRSEQASFCLFSCKSQASSLKPQASRLTSRLTPHTSNFTQFNNTTQYYITYHITYHITKYITTTHSHPHTTI